MEELEFLNNRKELLNKHGVIIRSGPRDNWTDCESDIIAIHIPTGCAKRFHGTFYDDEHVKSIADWIKEWNKTREITAEEMLYYYDCCITDLINLKED